MKLLGFIILISGLPVLMITKLLFSLVFDAITPHVNISVLTNHIRVVITSLVYLYIRSQNFIPDEQTVSTMS